MAGMVGEVDALAVGGLAAAPDRPDAGDHPGERRQADRGHRLQQGEGVGANVKLAHRAELQTDAATSDAAANTATGDALLSRAGGACRRCARSSVRVAGRGGFQPHARQHIVDRGAAAGLVWHGSPSAETAARRKASSADRARVTHAGMRCNQSDRRQWRQACGPATGR